MRNHFMTFFLYLQYRPEQVVISLYTVFTRRSIDRVKKNHHQIAAHEMKKDIFKLN